MDKRSSRADVRNPLLSLPAAQRFAELPPEAREALRALLLDFQRQARDKGNEAWRKHKPPMAAYWKAWAVNAGHAARLLPKKGQCRADGRCQYAIDHGAEGLGHCPPGKCAMS